MSTGWGGVGVGGVRTVFLNTNTVLILDKSNTHEYVFEVERRESREAEEYS